MVLTKPTIFKDDFEVIYLSNNNMLVVKAGPNTENWLSAGGLLMRTVHQQMGYGL